jgi:hypothetical protein
MTRRMFSPEYLESGAAPGRIRLTGARNGTYSAQVVVGTDRALANVKVAGGRNPRHNGRGVADYVAGAVGHLAGPDRTRHLARRSDRLVPDWLQQFRA